MTPENAGSWLIFNAKINNNQDVLGASATRRPVDRGYDEYYGLLSG